MSTSSVMQPVQHPHRHAPHRQDTFQLRQQHEEEQQQHSDHSSLDYHQQQQQQPYQGHYTSASDEEHSVLEDDSPDEQYIEEDDQGDDDGSSSLSIPSESIDFDLVYSIQRFVATVEGQANVDKGDSLFLMDDSNSYWWLVRVLKTQEVGYIPAENIETPFERLARLNKYRNVDLASATQQERGEDTRAAKRARHALTRTSPYQDPTRSVIFTGSFVVHQYPAFLWNGEPEGESEEEEYESYEEGDEEQHGDSLVDGMEPDDGMEWEEGAVHEAQAQAMSLNHAPTTQQSQLGLGSAPNVRSQGSRERVISGQERTLDPAEATGTRTISVTPTVAKGPDSSPVQQHQQPTLHRSGSGESSTSLASRTSETGKTKTSVDSSASSNGSKLRKNSGGRTTPDTGDESGGESGKKQKKGGIFSGIFSKKKDKPQGRKGISDSDLGRGSEDSGISPSSSLNDTSARKPLTQTQVQAQTPESRRTRETQQSSQSQGPVSVHASKLQQKDQQEQALYQQYLNRSPSSPPDASLAFGTQSAASQGHHLTAPSAPNMGRTPGGRPGSLIITGNVFNGESIVPELSVMRVFAGENLQSEATFKTVLLNNSTTAGDLVKQAIQRFRLPQGEDPDDYFLTVRQLEGDEAMLRIDERPLMVFEELVESALNMPTVKRSSISSISSNLSMQPAITKLGMNDFTDDSAVKFYLNRRRQSHDQDEYEEEHSKEERQEEESKLEADESMLSNASTDPVEAALGKLQGTGRPQLSLNVVVTPDRFSTPTSRFAVQVVIFADDLPDSLIFDPLTEAIVPRYSLQSRPPSGATSAVSQTQRKKVFVFPKNTTVAEVIEQSLDMFGIQEGVVDGGDEVEDKAFKRGSSSRVRYGLGVQMPGEGSERELNPSSKVIEAFPRPPTFKQNNRRSSDMRRRSMDASQLLGTPEDVQPTDPIFVLRRAATYRQSGTSRNRLSAPLDEMALYHLQQRESVQSENSVQSEYTSVTESNPNSPPATKPSQRDIIMAQRAASRANQKALLTAHSNEEQGVDLVVPEQGTLRSTRSAVDERTRYSYIQPDGETYDISDLIDEELWDVAAADGRPDLFQDVLVKPRDVMEQRIDQVLAKIKGSVGSSTSSKTPTGMDDRRSPTPRSGSALGQQQLRNQGSWSRSNTPLTGAEPETSRNASGLGHRGGHSHQPSLGSIMSDLNPTDTSAGSGSAGLKSSMTDRTTPGSSGRSPIILRDDFGYSRMMAVIEAEAALRRPPPPPRPSEVDELLFGHPVVLEDLHPGAREMYGPIFEQMESVNKQLDMLLHSAFRT